MTAGLERVGRSVTSPLVEVSSLQEAVLTVGPILARLPRTLDDAARSLLRGELRTRVSLLSEPEDVRVAAGLVNRVVLAGVGSAVAVSSALLLTVQRPGDPLGVVGVAGGTGLVFAALLLLRVVAQILRDRD